MTPGEAKQGYSFIKRIVDSFSQVEQDELEKFLCDFYYANKECSDEENLEFLLGTEIDKEKSISKENKIMQNFVEYCLTTGSDKDLYLKHLNHILSYICENEEIIEEVMNLYRQYDTKIKVIEKNKKEDYIVEKLDNLIGLENVKKQIKQLANWAYVTKLRKEKGLKANNITMHMVFTGSPGTGKTTVARIIADIYHKLGIIEENKLKEVSREDLVAEYLGQSENKTKKVLEESKGGVLFIDEAYSLTKNNDEYGTDVVNTILKFMEDNRDNTVIIIAGYPKEMEQFIKSNPGLQSRFNTYLTFNNYNSDELIQILKTMIESNDYKISEKDLEKLKKEIEKVDTTDISFSNARYVRNLFENATKNQATRIAENLDISEEDLETLVFEDFL